MAITLKKHRYKLVMKLRNYSIFSLLIMPIIALAGSENVVGAEQKSMEIQVEQLYAGSQCNYGGAAGGSWVANQQQLESVYQVLQKGKFGGSTYTLPNINFKNAGVLLVNMGQKHTGGYGVTLLHTAVTINGTIATIQVRWLEPAPGGIQTQVLTSPCVLIKLPLNAYRQINVIDQAKLLRAEVKVEL